MSEVTQCDKCGGFQHEGPRGNEWVFFEAKVSDPSRYSFNRINLCAVCWEDITDDFRGSMWKLIQEHREGLTDADPPR